MSESMILEEALDESYEPTNEGKFYAEIIEYAEYLGFDLPKDA